MSEEFQSTIRWILGGWRWDIKLGPSDSGKHDNDALAAMKYSNLMDDVSVDAECA